VVQEDGTNSPKVLFKSQIVMNSAVGKLDSPHASMESAWSGRTGNTNEYFASVFVAAIRIDDALLTAAARMQMPIFRYR
jgi:hypothetical protein